MIKHLAFFVLFLICLGSLQIPLRGYGSCNRTSLIKTITLIINQLRNKDCRIILYNRDHEMQLIKLQKVKAFKLYTENDQMFLDRNMRLIGKTVNKSLLKNYVLFIKDLSSVNVANLNSKEIELKSIS
jgi:hypothetical protein